MGRCNLDQSVLIHYMSILIQIDLQKCDNGQLELYIQLMMKILIIPMD